jgi:hypothetical protein
VKSSSLPDLASAMAVRSSSQEATTLPRRHTSATSATLMSKRSLPAACRCSGRA